METSYSYDGEEELWSSMIELLYESLFVFDYRSRLFKDMDMNSSSSHLVCFLYYLLLNMILYVLIAFLLPWI